MQASINKKETAREHLKKQVLTLALPPGHPLDEVLLSKQYDLSRTPLREVLQRLSGEGYVNLEANRGAYVTSMDLATMRNFFQSAPMIYAAIARLAAEVATTEQIDTLTHIQKHFRKAVAKNTVTDMSLLNYRFHEYIGVIADSPYLAPSLRRLLIDHTRMSHRFYRTQKPQSQRRIVEATQQHDELIMALAQHNPVKAVEITVAHWELSRSEMDKYVLPDSLPIEAVEEQATGKPS